MSRKLKADDTGRHCRAWPHKGAKKLLPKAVSELRAPDLPPKLADPKPITTTSLAKDQGLDKILKKLDNGGGLDALLSCGGLDDLQHSYFNLLPFMITYHPKPGMVSTLYNMAGSLQT